VLVTAVAAQATSSAPDKPVTQSARRSNSAQQASMDLHAPPLSHIFPRQELQYILVPDSDADSTEEVSVKSPKYGTPVPLGQFQAIPWALMHPTQVWRIFTPVEQP
jgi:hypothetical protein